MREEILKKWDNCFKEVLIKDNRMDHPPVKIRLKENSDVTPSYCMHPFDTPVHLRKMYEKEVKNCLDAGIKWSSKAFPVFKGSGEGVKIVADFKKLNKAIERLTWPTETSTQLLLNINPEVKYFVSLDITSGY